MGNNAAGSTFAATIVLLYDAGVLNTPIVKGLVVATADNSGDVDFGDAHEIASKDHLDFQQIIARVVLGDYVTAPKLPNGNWTPDEDAANEAFQERKAAMFDKALKKLRVKFD